MTGTKNTFLALLAVLLSPMAANADIVDVAPSGGIGTFIDENTGLEWLDLDLFAFMTPNEMIAAAAELGFTWATRSDVEELLLSLPLTEGEWGLYKSIMGDSATRELIWGVYDDGDDNSLYGWGYAYSGMTSWSILDNVGAADLINNSVHGDLAIWAYRTESVPEPGTLALIGLGLLGMAARRRRQV